MKNQELQIDFLHNRRIKLFKKEPKKKEFENLYNPLNNADYLPPFIGA